MCLHEKTGRVKGNFYFSEISSALPKWLFISKDGILYIFVQLILCFYNNGIKTMNKY